MQTFSTFDTKLEWFISTKIGLFFSCAYSNETELFFFQSKFGHCAKSIFYYINTYIYLIANGSLWKLYRWKRKIWKQNKNLLVKHMQYHSLKTQHFRLIRQVASLQCDFFLFSTNKVENQTRAGFSFSFCKS